MSKATIGPKMKWWNFQNQSWVC